MSLPWTYDSTRAPRRFVPSAQTIADTLLAIALACVVQLASGSL